MFDVNTAGRATQPKSKTINVEANLMAQRLIERRSLIETNRRRMVMLFAVVFSSLLTLPALFTWMNAAGATASQSIAQEQNIQKRLADLRKKEDTARPVIQENQLLSVVDSRANNYLGRIVQFLNCVEPDMAISSLKVEVIAGQMKIIATSEAENYEAYKKFIARCQDAVGSDNVFPRSVKASTALGPKGVVFDLEHKTKVGS